MKRNYIVVNGLKVHWNFWLLPKGFMAITLFGHIFFNESEQWVKNYVETQEGKETINHERIHTLQSKTFKTKYLGMYIYYLWFWFIGLFKYGCKDYASYYNIPFEKEAFENETNFDYSKSEWRNYINDDLT